MLEQISGQWSVGWSIAAFVIAGAATVVCGIRLTALGDTLADRTGWGEALFGAVFFGLATSLSGIVMTGVSAADGHPQLAYGNAVGGIAAQTLAVVVADAVYRGVNLEHAASSSQNLLFGSLLLAMLGIALMASLGPQGTFLGVHPASAVLVAVYLGALRLIQNGERPLWRAVRTKDTVADVPDDSPSFPERRTGSLWTEFAGVAAVVVVGGWAVARAAESLVEATGLNAGLVGGVFMGVVNALPETVTAIAAVRRGAVTLAIAAVIGGNCLDVLNLAVGDVAYRGGSLYEAAGADQLFMTSGALVMTAVLLAGLLVRQRRGWLRLGFDGILLITVYAVIVVALAV
ncbi:cation transporter [Streptomyces sp. WAC 00631]|uniref:sodium:calcium antiporter n=1 Tax=Streptomyces sp. MNU89 TaxID=2560025 RepID=UPI000F78DD17|nr:MULTISPECIES: cation transporter [unclassified Streptomyces]MCC5032123.1 cation transporter [Streptomyces sp. WAC 00631]MCC9740224.1 cation transporter [Streptomyces sp. MNU89]